MPIQNITDNNQLVDVATLTAASLPFMPNANPWVAQSDHRFDAISSYPGQLGQFINIRKPIQATANRSLKWNTQALVQQYTPLAIDKPYESSMVVSATQEMFNLEDYLDTTVRPMVSSIGDKIGQDVADLSVSKPYRFFGQTDKPFDSVSDLIKLMAQFKNFGFAAQSLKCVLWDMTIANIITGQANLFTPRLNDQVYNSWDLGTINGSGGCNFYSSNISAIHLAGTEGQAGTTLTIVSIQTNPDDAGEITGFTLSGCSAASDADSIKLNDSMFFVSTAGKTLPVFLTKNSGITSGNVVQMRSTSNAASSAGSQVTVTIYPPLRSSNGSLPANVNTPIQTGMRMQVLNSHRATMMWSGGALFCAIPPMPMQDPFNSSTKTDPDSNVSLLYSSGWVLGEFEFKFGYNAVAGMTADPDFLIKIVQPI